MQRDALLEALGLTPWRLRQPPLTTAVAETAAPTAVQAPSSDTYLPEMPTQKESMAQAAAPLIAPQPAPATTQKKESAAETLSPEARKQHIAQISWADFDADVAACTACGLCQTRTKTVPGVGNVNARWLFVGEGPGAEENKKGEPFVGQAGRLLDQMLAALGLKRDADVYITNVLKCRPPGNRAPAPQEADACRPYLERQITLIQPQLIVALGKSAASLLLNTDNSIASLRGRVHRYRGVPLVVTYHPAYLLRSLTDKAKSWEDLLFARKQLNANGVVEK